MRIAVTGATGFIGQHLVHELLARGDRLLLLGRDIEKLRTIFGTGSLDVALVEADFGRDANLVFENIDAIVHAGGLRWWKDRIIKDYIMENVIPTENLYAAALASGVSSIIFLSSIAVYNPAINGLPFTEGVDCLPVTHYGVSKLICEKIGGYFTSEYGLKIKALRVGQVVGIGERGGFMLGKFIEQARSGQTLPIFGEGAGARDYVYITDLVSAVLLAIDHTATEGVFNISLGRPVTHLQLAEAINQAFGNAGNLSFHSDKAEDKSRLWMSCERARRELDWKPRWNLDEMFLDLAGKMVDGKG